MKRSTISRRTAAGVAIVVSLFAMLAAAAERADAGTAKLVRVPHGHSRAVCRTRPGHARCTAFVATNARGVPLVVKAPATPTSPVAVDTNATYGYSPQNFHSAYNLPWRSGVQQTIAIVDAYDHPNVKGDLDYFDSAWGLGAFPSCSSTVTTACFQRVDEYGYARGFVNNDAAAARAWAVETNLDVQAAHGICLNCKILLVETYTDSRSDLARGVNTAAALGATEISNSYGWPESGLADWNPSAYVHPGIAITASAHDYGYGAYYPADLNSVIAVGGTRLLLNSDGSYNSETVWGDGVSSPTGHGTGSGCSTFDSTYTQAPTWQRNLANWAYTGCGTLRAVADVSADADPDTGAWVYNSAPNEYGQTGWFRFGGTSLSAPLIAGVYALAGNAGYYNWPGQIPYLYPSRLHDVTSGSNGSCGAYIMCHGWTGYDGPTGLGTPAGLGSF
jgi:subtilase family serine protease